ncbi:hypothetical protein DX912_10190 [Lysobacter soli]|uniref:Uncharacterized protein n=1 Tax=Lysobacter soli TaxID=453783 RepID=A0A3D8VCF6_9GAMM|nr:hypothetical protein DX912_10190 [Lysobacter soli]
MAQTVEYMHTDALGSVVAVTDSAGSVIERNQYEPYGEDLTGIKDGAGYTGHVSDAATGLSYMQQRYYDPQLGRFLSVDPVTANGGTGANFNRYWYGNNNPYTFTDPDGRQASSFFLNGLEPVLHAEMAYGAYKQGRMSASETGQFLRSLGAPGAGRLAEIRGVLRQDARALENERRNGVARAWAAEKRLVSETGTGTRDWTKAQINELLETGSVKGIEGHHINSVNDSPELAGVADNIKFLTRTEHQETHGGNFRNATSGDMVYRGTGAKARMIRVIETGSNIIRRVKK